MGIGAAIAEELAGEGARVALVARGRDALDAEAAKIGASARSYPCDMSDPGAIAAMVADVERDLGPVDILINNVGAGTFKPLHQITSLRAMFRNRAQRRLLRVAAADLDDLRADERWALIVDLGAGGIASADVEGYLEESDLDGVMKDYLLVDADRDANVVLHVVPGAQYAYPDSRLRLAADLAEHRGPREEARAAQLLHELAMERKAADR
jgi:NAD(P)-dependent dehydrogenase (short-subunit alcohol dehydrogenase family)